MIDSKDIGNEVQVFPDRERRDEIAKKVIGYMNKVFSEQGIDAKVVFDKEHQLGRIGVAKDDPTIKNLRASINRVGFFKGEVGRECSRVDCLPVLKNLGVKGERKTGMGSKILGVFEEAILDQGLDTVVVTNIQNDKVANFWKKNGYDRIEKFAKNYARVKIFK